MPFSRSPKQENPAKSKEKVITYALVLATTVTSSGDNVYSALSPHNHGQQPFWYAGDGTLTIV
jgi:hypothetical protein